MFTTAFATPTLVTKSDLQEVVRSWGGRWAESEESGFITRFDKEGGTIHVFSPEGMTEEQDPEQHQELTLIFGSEPLIMIWIGVIRLPGSDRLVQDFTQDLITRFGGVLDYNGRWHG